MGCIDPDIRAIRNDELTLFEIEAVQHRVFPMFGLQFHPEHILTPDGGRLLRNSLFDNLI